MSLNKGGKLNDRARRWIEDQGVKDCTAATYAGHLLDFQCFCAQKLEVEIDQLIKNVLADKDSFSILTEYSNWLVNDKMKKSVITSSVIRNRTGLVKRFLKDNGINVQNDGIIPRTAKTEKPLPSRNMLAEIVQILPLSVKTYCIFLAALGWRPKEVFWLSPEDIDESRDPPIVQLTGLKAKILGRERRMYLSNEAYHEYKKWMRFKHRNRRISRPNGSGGYDHVFLNPCIRHTDLIFAPYREKSRIFNEGYLAHLYRHYRSIFVRMLDALGYSSHQIRKRRIITFDTIRLSISSSLGRYSQYEFAEYYRGRLTSSYWGKPERVRIAMFKESETYLSILGPQTTEFPTSNGYDRFK